MFDIFNQYCDASTLAYYFILYFHNWLYYKINFLMELICCDILFGLLIKHNFIFSVFLIVSH